MSVFVIVRVTRVSSMEINVWASRVIEPSGTRYRPFSSQCTRTLHRKSHHMIAAVLGVSRWNPPSPNFVVTSTKYAMLAANIGRKTTEAQHTTRVITLNKKRNAGRERQINLMANAIHEF